VAVITNINVDWPARVVPILKACSVLTLQFDKLVQLGCWAGDQSATFSLCFKWVAPLAVIPLVFAAVPFARIVSWLLECIPSARAQRYAPLLKHSFTSGVMFLYMLWQVYFATLTSNCFLIFTCNRHPNGEMRVAMYPDIVCGSSEFWLYSTGGACAVFVYVILFFVVSNRALQNVATSLKESCFLDRGSFEFVTDGLRTPHIHFNIYGAFKDVLLSLVVVCLAHDATSQLFVSAFLLFFWASGVLYLQPFDTPGSNLIEAWCSAGLGLFLFLCVGFGYAIAGSQEIAKAIQESDSSHSIWLLAVLLGAFAIPVLLLVMEVCIQLQVCTCWVPRFLRVKSPDQVRQEVRDFKQGFEYAELDECMEVMDHVEWDAFVNALGVSESRKMHFKKIDMPSETQGRLASPNHHHSLSLRDSELASVRSRANVRRFKRGMTLNLEDTCHSCSVIASHTGSGNKAPHDVDSVQPSSGKDTSCNLQDDKSSTSGVTKESEHTREEDEECGRDGGVVTMV